MSRRSDLSENTATELAIRAAMAAVEELGADERLTHAVVALDKALGLVGDWVDGIPLRTDGDIQRCDLLARTAIALMLGAWRSEDAEALEDSVASLVCAEKNRKLRETHGTGGGR